MTRTQIKASLALWARRLAFRRKMVARGKNVAKWTALAKQAEAVIERRQAQLVKSTPLRLRAFDEAVKLVGIMEHGGNNTGPEVSKIIRANGGVVGEPWCGDFQAYVYRLAGSVSVTRSWASVYLLGRLSGVRKVSKQDVRRGDLVRFTFSHVGMFDEWISKPAGTFKTIEGNTGAVGAVSDSTTGGDGVYRKQRNTGQVEDFRRVSR